MNNNLIICMLPNKSDILLKGPYKSNNTYIYRIICKDTKKIIQVTTPNIYINNYNPEYSSLLISCDHLKLGNSYYFQKFIKEIENNIIFKCKKLIKKIENINGCTPKFISCLREWNGNYYISCSLFSKNIGIYDSLKNKTKLDVSDKNIFSKISIWIKDVIITKDKYYITLNVMQIRILEPLPPLGCIIESDSEMKKINNQLNLVHNIIQKPLDKYEKMIKMGVPIHIVEMKKKIDKNSNQGNKMNLLGGISNIQLKKIDPTSICPAKKSTSSNKWGPSLEEILSSKNKLRKVI